MKRILALLGALFLVGCGQAGLSEESAVITENITYQEQSPEYFGIEQTTAVKKLNYHHTVGEWFPYMQYEEDMYGKTAEEFRLAVRRRYTAAKADGVNTVYLHVHPCGDAYYKSDIFPKGVCLDGDYDPFEIMLEEAHSLEMSVHAWINPLRCQTAAQMENLPEDFIVKKWADDPDCNIAVEINGRWYLNPAYKEVDELLADCIGELAGSYDIDGVHIDDYFYPTTDPDFDQKEFSASNDTELAEWRMSNCNRMVRSMYNAVKAADPELEFGISPQGSINGNYNTQYADVRLWCSNEGYCDYIVPQIYFGFENEACPFAETLALWESMRSAKVRLIIGLGAYKVGKADKWAGAGGENEWIDSPDIIQRQIDLVENSSADGYALYK